MTVTEIMRQRLVRIAEESGQVEVRLLSPTNEAEDILTRNNCRLVRKGYETWCNSDTCNHVSHDAGQDYQVWLVSQAFVSEAKDASEDVWDMADYSPELVVAGEDGQPVLLATTRSRHYANQTRVVYPHPILREGKGS